MLLKCWLLSAGIAMFIIAAGIFTYDVFLLIAYQRRGSNFDPERGMSGSASRLAPTPHWRTTVALVMAGMGSAAHLGWHRDRLQRNGRHARQSDHRVARWNSAQPNDDNQGPVTNYRCMREHTRNAG